MRKPRRRCGARATGMRMAWLLDGVRCCPNCGCRRYQLLARYWCHDVLRQVVRCLHCFEMYECEPILRRWTGGE